MPFKPGQSKPAGSGRAKGTKNKKKVVKITDFIAEREINLPDRILSTIDSIQDPAVKAKLLIEYYKFIDAPLKDKSLTDESEQTATETQDEAQELSDEQLIALSK